MGDLRVLVGPVSLTGPLPAGTLALGVAVDAVIRRARAGGRAAAWFPIGLAGDPATQHAVDLELARDGYDRAALGREGFVVRVVEFQDRVRAEVLAEVDLLGILPPDDAVATDDAELVAAARVAFIRLYEQGLVQRRARVVDVCTRCVSVVDPADAVAGEVEVERVILTVPFAAGDGELYLGTAAPELLAGCVAIAVPPGHMAAGRKVVNPLDDRVVPAVVDREAASARFVVPGHVATDVAFAAGHRLAAIEVYGLDGTVLTGPQSGQRRYAARAAARRALEEADLVVGVEAGSETVGRCERCGTVLAPHLGEHWFLDVAALERAAADVLREAVIFAPPAFRDEVLDATAAGGTWCISHRLWAGVPVPAVECLDCGSLDVTAGTDSCRRCAGPVAPDPNVLDARFIAALWPLVAGGWPARPAGLGDLAPDTVLAVPAGGAERDVARAAALGLRLAGRLPFAQVLVLPVDPIDDDPNPALPVPLADLLDDAGLAVVRAALAAGGLDLDAARALVAAVEEPPEGDADLDVAAATIDDALAAGNVRQALAVLAGLAHDGVRASAADRLRALAAPILGG